MKTKLFIGIDISKSWIDVTAFDALDEKLSKHKQFANDMTGFQALNSWVDCFDLMKSEIVFCLEHTGVYSYAICNYLAENELYVWVENPLQIKRSMGLKRAKNDKIDSLEIAKYAYRFIDRAKPFKLPPDGLADIQNLEALRKRLIKSKVLLENPVNELDISETNSFIKEKTTCVINEIKSQIKDIEKKISDLIKKNEEMKRLYNLSLSVPRIGPQTAIMLMIYTRCYTSFQNVRQLACYCGLAPFEQNSGSSIRTKPRVSNLANKKLKSLLHAGATSLLQHNKETKKFYERKRLEGKHHNCIMNVIRYKILNHVMAVTRRGSEFIKQEEYIRQRKAA